MIIILSGFVCAGKTSVGKLLAEMLGFSFLDSDRLVEAAFGQNKSVTEIYKEMGNVAFRELETQAIFSLKKEDSVVALGGGTLLFKENRDFLKKLGIVIYLKAPLVVLFERVKKRGFPAYLDRANSFAHFEKIAKERFPIYEKHCHYMIETDTLHEMQVAEKIWEAIVSDRFSGLPPGANLTEKPLALSSTDVQRGLK